MKHKNKTLACLLAAVAGGIGAHRYYLNGKSDKLAWLHSASLPISAVFASIYFDLPGLLTWSPFILSILIAMLTALVLGLTADEKWDAQYNTQSGQTSASTWPLALLLVLTGAIGAVTLIAVIARTFDLLYTGGAYG